MEALVGDAACPRCAAPPSTQVEEEAAGGRLCSVCGLVLNEAFLTAPDRTAPPGRAVAVDDDGVGAAAAALPPPAAGAPRCFGAQASARRGADARARRVERVRSPPAPVSANTSQLASTLRLSPAATAQLHALLARLAEREPRCDALLTAAACFALARLDARPLPLAACAAAAQVEPAALLRTARRLARALGEEGLPAAESGALLDRALSACAPPPPPALRAAALRLLALQSDSGMATGREPRALCAAALSLAAASLGWDARPALDALGAARATAAAREAELLQIVTRVAAAALPYGAGLGAAEIRAAHLPFLLHTLLPSMAPEAVQDALGGALETGPPAFARAEAERRRRAQALAQALARVDGALAETEPAEPPAAEADAAAIAVRAAAGRGLRPLGAPRGRGPGKRRAPAAPRPPAPPTPAARAAAGEAARLEEMLRAGVPQACLPPPPRARAHARTGGAAGGGRGRWRAVAAGAGGAACHPWAA